MKLPLSLVIVAACLSTMPAAHAEQDPMPLEGCATLGDGQQIVRGSGNGKRIYVRDGEDHYQLTFRNGCSAAVLASKISISTDGQANKLCSEATKVKADRQTCRVSEVTRISPEEFDRQKKRARH